MADQFRKKPVVIEAVQWNGGAETYEVANFLGYLNRDKNDVLTIATLEGGMYALPGDWIIKGVRGEFYSCKPDIFAQTYEPA